MAVVELYCMRCMSPLAFEEHDNSAHEAQCAACGTVQVHHVYPALSEPSATPTPLRLSAFTEGATCFNHASSPASGLCDACGRYLCDLCSLEVPESVNGPADLPRLACPVCFAKIQHDELAPRQWDLFRVLYPRYDLICLYLACAPFVLLPLSLLTPFTVPVCFYLMIRHWRDSRDPVRRYRTNFVFASAFMVLTLLIWAMIGGLLAASILGGSATP